MKSRIGMLALFALFVALLWLNPLASQDANRADLERRVDQTIREYGTVESAKTVVISSEIEGEATILSLVREGSAVKKGDLLVALDDSKWQERRSQMAIELRTALASVEAAKRKIASAKTAAAQFQEFHELSLKVAELNQNKHQGEAGAFAVSLRNLERKEELAESRKKLTAAMIARRKLANDGVPPEELELEAKKAELELVKARDEIQFLKTMEQPHQSAVLKLAVVQAKSELLKQRHESEASIQEAEAEFEAAKLVQSRAEADLKHVEDQLAKCRITAPSDGIVLYASTATRRSAATDAIEEGATLRERQPILQIMDVSQLQLKTLVHESRIRRVNKGQTARIRFDALPNQTFEGKVLSVNRTPEPASFFSSDVKTYAVYVSLEGPVDKLKLGLSALVEIEAP